MPPTGGRAPTPYIPNTDADRAIMLDRIGVPSVDALFDQLPADYLNPDIDLPPALPEHQLIAHLQRVAGRNTASSGDHPSFLGAGAYHRAVPAIAPYLISRSEFATSYTPYQPEISQGTLQAAFEYQSVVCELTGMDVSNTGMYDGASSTAEACLLAARQTRRKAVALLEPIHPNVVDVVKTYAYGADLRVDVITGPNAVSAEHACLVIQQPDFLGAIQDIEPLAAAAHEVDALAIVMADPFALGMLRAPGDADADIVTGEGRDLAGPVNFGGPSLGIFAARQQFLRQMPGRIVGRAQEVHAPDGGEPRTGYVLTLQTREQFIRRERATSNLSTGQSLIALAFTITLESMGPDGFRDAADYCYQQAHDAAARIDALPGFQLVERGPWFQEFLVRGPVPPAELNAELARRGITGGLDVSERPEPEAAAASLFCVTEATDPGHVDRLVAALTQIGEEYA
jgi:glycine dehydrogenase subunit 1